MPNEKKDGMKIKLYSNLEIVFLTEMSFFSNLKRKNIRFNLKPRENPINLLPKPIKPVEKQEEKTVDLHLEIAKRIDKITAKNENITEEPEFVTISEKPTFQNEKKLIEIRKPWMKNPDNPSFKTDFEGEINFTHQPTREDLFKVQIPQTTQSELALETSELKNITFTKIPEQNHNKMHSFFLHKKNQDSKKVLTSLGRIKIRSKEKRTETSSKIQQTNQKSYRNNGFTQTKKELEMTMTELEKKKKEIQEMEQLAKLKEEELKEKQEERKKKEKQKELELKKKEKLEKTKKRQEEKLDKQRKIEQLKQEKLKKLEMKKAEREKQKMLIKQERLKKLEAKELEKQKILKQIEAEKAEKEKLIEQQKLEKQKIKEQQILEKQKQIEAKELEKQKILKQIEAEKAEKEKLKEQQKLEKQKELETKIQIKLKEKKPIKGEEKEIPAPKPEILEPTLIKEPEPIIEPEPVKEPEPIKEQKLTFDEEVSQVFTIIDDLLEKLPEEAIDEFLKSDDFVIYEKVVNKYKNKR